MPDRKTGPDHARLDRVVAEARRVADERSKGYREQALKIYPWVCGDVGATSPTPICSYWKSITATTITTTTRRMGAIGNCYARTAMRMNISVSSRSMAGTRSLPGPQDQARLRTIHSPT
jgi:hypothetical protein